MATKPKAKTNGSEDAEGQSVSTIRDILFGEQMADYESRFAELERQLTERFEELKNDLTRHVEELTETIQRERADREDHNPSRARLADLFDTIADQLRSKSG